MIIAEMLGWWYSRGWLWIAQQVYIVQMSRLLDFFSVKDLLKTLFSPFRQDVIDTKNAPIGVKLQVFGGNLISRLLGAMIRTTLIIIGLLFMIILALAGFLLLVIWPFFPLTPIISLILWFGVI